MSVRLVPKRQIAVIEMNEDCEIIGIVPLCDEVASGYILDIMPEKSVVASGKEDVG